MEYEFEIVEAHYSKIDQELIRKYLPLLLETEEEQDERAAKEAQELHERTQYLSDCYQILLRRFIDKYENAAEKMCRDLDIEMNTYNIYKMKPESKRYRTPPRRAFQHLAEQKSADYTTIDAMREYCSYIEWMIDLGIDEELIEQKQKNPVNCFGFTDSVTPKCSFLITQMIAVGKNS
jgi:hypothetical protein